MRAALRLFAAVKPGQYLEAGTPTGLTGLATHPSPRSTLVFLYSSTLDKLQKIPPSSVYRQSTEALTKHRLQIIEAVKPHGWDAWTEKIQMQVEESPDAFELIQTTRGTRVRPTAPSQDVDDRTRAAEWDGEVGEPTKEGIRTQTERTRQIARMAGGDKYRPESDLKQPTLDPEPQLTADQISEVESQIGAGLIEEIIQVAEGEHQLVDEMVNSKVWEPLEEPAPEGQWTYFERGGHTKTQHP